MEIIKNTWFVGISTGIISGIVVFFFAKWIMDRKERVEYFKRVSNANQNIIETLKTYCRKWITGYRSFGCIKYVNGTCI